MTCLICHGEDIHETEVKEAMPLGTDLVYIPIRILVCQTCGERYYDRRTIQYLEEVEHQLQAGTASLQEVGKVLELTKESG